MGGDRLAFRLIGSSRIIFYFGEFFFGQQRQQPRSLGLIGFRGKLLLEMLDIEPRHKLVDERHFPDPGIY